MEIAEAPKASLWLIAGLVAVFALMATVSLYVAVTDSTTLVADLWNQNDSIVFNKGLFYLYGVGLTALVFVFGLVYSRLVDNQVSDTVHRWLSRLLLGGVVLTLALPQVTHFSVSTYLEEHGYRICQKESHRWLYVVSIVYVRNLPCGEVR